MPSKKWIRVHCHVPENHEKYIISVGDMWGGTVSYNGSVWRASYETPTWSPAMEGGGMTRLEAMEWVESHIKAAIADTYSFLSPASL